MVALARTVSLKTVWQKSSSPGVLALLANEPSAMAIDFTTNTQAVRTS